MKLFDFLKKKITQFINRLINEIEGDQIPTDDYDDY